MPRPTVDYSLYLVTDSGLLPPGRDFAEQVERAIKGGVTLVQLREKKLSTAEFIKRGRQIHAITRKYNIPLIINDRIDVALAVGAEGLHIGWDDCDVKTARELLGPDKIIGVSVTNLDELHRLRGIDCDYLGVGPVYATNTKPDHDPPLGVNGLRRLLDTKNFDGLKPNIPIVVIGGVNTSNLQWIKYAAGGDKQMVINGPAVVSAIMAADEPERICESFQSLLRTDPPFAQKQNEFGFRDSDILEDLRDIILTTFQNVKKKKSMVHHITNDVVKNFNANVCLAAGASPIMSENIEETAELAAINGALVINMGTAGKEAHALYFEALRSNNMHGNPVVFDPVGAGASKLRRSTTMAIIGAGYCDVVKGNEGEIRTVAGEDVKMLGVDHLEGTVMSVSKQQIVADLARRHRNIVVMTGVTDYVSDGHTVVALSGGHPFQGTVTGTGCSLGTLLAVALANNRHRKFSAVIAAIIVYNYAAMRAAEGAKGPGSWSTAFIDWIWRLCSEFEVDTMLKEVGSRKIGMGIEYWSLDEEQKVKSEKKWDF